MADVRSMFDSEYLGAWDLQGRDVAVTIKRVVAGTLQNKTKKNKKPIVYFEGKEKGMAVNKTNMKTIAGMFGYRAEDWIGKRITIYPTKTQFGSDEVDCIRVRPMPPGSKVKDMPPDLPADREPGSDDAEDDKGDAPTEAELAAVGR